MFLIFYVYSFKYYFQTKCTSTNTESIGIFSDIQTSTSRNALRPETNFESTRLPTTSEEVPVSEIKKDDTIYTLDSSNENSSIMKKRKSLFDLNHEDNYGKKLLYSCIIYYIFNCFSNVY